MWRRFRRRTFAPARPAVFPEQVGLLLVSLLVIAMGVAAIVVVLA